jgi:uncharacterized damage-inducible protein DinB
MTMPPALRTVSHLFSTAETMLAEILEHLDEESLNFKPSEELSSALRLYAHLTVQRHRLVNALTGESRPIRFENVAGGFAEPGQVIPPKDEIDKDFKAITKRLHETFGRLTEQQLSGPGRGQGFFPTTDETLLGTITFIGHQEAYHLGQISYLARIQGKLPEIGYLG